MCQTYPMYACTGNNHTCHFIGLWYIFLQLEARVFTVTLEKKLDRKEVSSIWNNLIYNLCDITQM